MVDDQDQSRTFGTGAMSHRCRTVNPAFDIFITIGRPSTGWVPWE